jgi:hypothetical protein
VLQALADSPDAYADFIEAAAADRAIAEESSPRKTGTESTATPGVIPIGTKTNRAWRYAVPGLIAAGIIAVFFMRTGSEGRRGEMIVLAQSTHVLPAGTGSVASKLGDSWDQPQWSVSRGGDDASSDRARAFRAGARVAELEVAAQAGDSAAVRRVAGSLARLLTSAQAGTPTISQLRDFSEPASSTRAAVARQIRDLLGAPVNFDAGLWTETARMSLVSGNVDYIGATNSALTRLILDLQGSTRTGPNASLVSALQSIASAQSTSPNDKVLLSRLVDYAIATGAQ